jgi:membrane protein DedA with SNARE-associated domain
LEQTFRIRKKEIPTSGFCLSLSLCYFEDRMETIAQWVAQYGYAAIFSLLVLGIVGLPVPDESLLTFAGFLVYNRNLVLFPTFASAVLGSMCGITISYILGRSVGIYVLRHYGWLFHITPRRIEKMHSWFDRFGTWTLLIGYFVPGVRHFTAVVAGTSNLRPLVFAIFAYSGALIWSATFIGLGFFFGEQWSQVLAQVQRHLAVSAGGALILISLYVIWRFRKRDSK